MIMTIAIIIIMFNNNKHNNTKSNNNNDENNLKHRNTKIRQKLILSCGYAKGSKDFSPEMIYNAMALV